MTAPGMTSTIELAIGLLTVQTEVVGDPPEIITLVDLAGRIVRRIATPCPPGADLARLVVEVHGGVDRRLRGGLEARKSAGGETNARGRDTAARLFVLAVDAYLDGDVSSARHMMSCVADLLPDDEIVASNLVELARIQP